MMQNRWQESKAKTSKPEKKFGNNMELIAHTIWPTAVVTTAGVFL